MHFSSGVKVTVGALLTLVFTTFFGVAAYASDEHGNHKIDTLAPFSHVGDPHNYIAIATVMAVLLVVVLGTATLASSLFKK
ncbi:hypothetical protein KJY77_00135 [Canibacter sp. lx-72]|uniref:hypothetical protein n=1 Tax=Canibacter zhuwentaonis TaxID=2837491 RepID=UPI001BDD36DB|nr:hypothetical protein [Canibacter zhuwentaonis]MBT1017556.1 hypothetical protein [Canibacter zhuwentaonis]MBT1034767.1 hypothetical protein [Canibacter zhuwentaonis]